MADEAIKAALREAGDGAAAECMAIFGATWNNDVRQRIASAAVAAFLRAVLADEREQCAEFRKQGLSGAAMQSASTILTVAEWRDAVQRAARGGDQ